MNIKDCFGIAAMVFGAIGVYWHWYDHYRWNTDRYTDDYSDIKMIVLHIVASLFGVAVACWFFA